MPGAQVLGLEALAGRERAGQEAVAERHGGEEADAARDAPRQQRPQRLRRPHRQLGLDRAHREHLLNPLQLPHRRVVQARARPPGRPRADRAEPERAHLPGPHQLRHRPPGLLDRHLGVGAVQLVQVDDVRLEATQGGVAGTFHVPGAAVGHDVLVADQQPDLGRHEGVRPPLLQHPSQQQLVGERAVHVRRVQQGDAQVQGPVHRPHRLLAPLPGGAVRPVHRHAPQSDGPHRECRRADRPALHRS